MISTLFFSIRLMLLFLTLTGYSFFVYDKLKINPSFLPVVVLSSVACCMYFAGLLNVLVLTAKIITAAGLLLFLYYLLKLIRNKFSLVPMVCPGILFFLFVSLYFFILLKGVHLLQYDNFSHWGAIIKEMFYYNSLPDDRTIITFSNYPPGTAVFIFYVCKVIGYSESHALMAQSLLIASALSAMFCKIKFKDKFYFFLTVVAAVISLCVLSYDDTTLHIYNLLVDGVLGFLAASSVIIAYEYRKDIKRTFYAEVPVFTFLILVKDSGKIFFFLLLAFILFLQIQYNKISLIHFTTHLKLKIVYFGGLIGIPLINNTLWKAYVEKAYTGQLYSANKYAVSFHKYIENFKNSPPGFMQKLPGMLLNKVFDFSSINTRMFIAVNILSLIVIVLFLLLKKDAGLLKKCFVISNLMMAVYIVNLFILYAVVMNVDEAKTLSAFDRYFSTSVILFVIVQLLCIVHSICTSGFKFKGIVNIGTVCALLVCCIFVRGNLVKLCVRPDEQNFGRTPIRAVCEQARDYIGRDQSILLYNGSQSGGYYYYLLTYEMLSTKVAVLNDNDLDAGKDKIISSLSHENYILVTQDLQGFWAKLNAEGIYSDKQTGTVYKVESNGADIRIISLN